MAPAPKEELHLHAQNAARHKRQPDYSKLVPLVYAPLLPLLRLGLNKRVTPQTRDIIFGGAVLMALAHAGYVMSGDSTM